MPRRTPYDIAFGPESEERFTRIRDSLARDGRDPHDEDAFLLDREVAVLLRELVPEEGVGEAVREHLALLHHAYLYWSEGGWLIRLTKERTRALLAGERTGATPEAARLPRAFYLQFPERQLWLELGAGEPHQPLDGLFVRPWPTGGLFLLAICGMHPGTEGFMVVSVDGHPAEELARPDGSPLFSPVLSGGAAAGLFSITGGEELLELGARSMTIAADAVACAGIPHRAHHALEVG